MAVANAGLINKTVADPIAAYDSVRSLWIRCRAVCGGERFVKDYDGLLDVVQFTNLLMPFSPSMTQQQFNFYKAEAELPGIVAQYSKVVIGGLLRKQPQLKLPEGAPEGAYQWIMDAFSQDSSPLISFLDSALWEEIQTSRAWVYVDYPKIENADELSKEERQSIKPYPILWPAESVINWKMSTSSKDGDQKLVMLIIRTYEEVPAEANEFHDKLLDTVYVHEIVGGYYQIRKYQKATQDAIIPVVNGKPVQNYAAAGSAGVTGSSGTNTSAYELKETVQDIMFNGERLTVIPAWPLNGSIEVVEPVLVPIVDKEIHLYNKMSRRNHLLYGAATYTPIISSNMAEERFEEIVGSGLGTWIHLQQGDTADVLKTPTEALADMDRSIAAAIEEMAKMGLRMLSPESAQSGVALEIRNAAQTAQLGTLNVKISNQLSDIIAFMMNWRYDTDYTSEDVQLTLAQNFDSMPIGADWMRLVTEWYQAGLIPRSLWLQICKQSEVVPVDYNDDDGQAEMNQSTLQNQQDAAYTEVMRRELAGQVDAAAPNPDLTAQTTTTVAQPMQPQQ